MEPELFEVPVAGGTLCVGRWGDPAAPVVIAAHGITASMQNWRVVARILGEEIQLIAPDLRGRGGSGGLPGPYGMGAHADDLVAVMDHLGVERPVVAGHSMGAYVACVLAEQHPSRVERLVLVDGGPALPVPEGLDVDETLHAVIGPAMARLAMTFPDRAAYHQLWKDHPALQAHWGSDLQAYVDYDLVEGPDGLLRSKVSAEAVRGDGADILTPDGSAAAITRLRGTVHLLRAERGMFDQPEPLVNDEMVAFVRATTTQLTDEVVPDTNHYTIALSEHGARAIAQHLT